MPTERVLAKPLSGAEVIEAVVVRIREQLQKDCFLSPHMAYGSYSFTCNIDIQFQGSRIAGTHATVRGEQSVADAPQTEKESQQVTISDEPKPPNEVRRETGQEVPVLAKTPQGRLEERRVRYERKTGGKPKVTSHSALTAS